MCTLSILHERDLSIESLGSSGYVSVGLCCVWSSGAAKQYPVPSNQDPGGM